MSETDLLEAETSLILSHAPDLADAIARGQIETVYQPQFSLRDDRLVGAEALARWQHPDLGEIGAGPLFAIAEMQGLSKLLSQQVVASALWEFANWPLHLRMSVNIMPEEVAAAGFADAFLRKVVASDVDPARLTVEITEEVLLGDLPGAGETLAILREAGLHIALDDFGAGFCNFRYLKVLPLDYLKLDRSMVEGVADDARDLAVLRGIVAMASALGLKVIAEGIETQAQRDIVAAEGCDTFQGFLRAAPMPARAFRELALAQAAF